MFYNRIEIKKAARALLEGRKKTAALVGLSYVLPLLILYVFIFINYIRIIPSIQSGETVPIYKTLILGFMVIILSVLFAVFNFAMCRWTVQLAKSADTSNPDAPVAPTVKDFFKFMTPVSIGLFFWCCLKIFLWELLLILAAIPFVVMELIAKNSSPVLIFVLVIVGLLLFGFVYLIVLAKATSYSMAFYTLADNPKLKVTESTKVSLEVTKGFRENLFVTYLSFYGWFLLGIVTLGIGYIWIVPYFFQTFANSWLFMKNEKANKLIAIE